MFKRDQQRELSPMDTGVLGDARIQLLCKCRDDPHSQSLALAEVEAGGQPDPIVAYRYESSFRLRSGNAYPNLPIGTIRKSIFSGVGDKLVDDQCQRNGSIGVELNVRRSVKVELTMGGHADRARAHLLQVCAEVDVFDVDIIG